MANYRQTPGSPGLSPALSRRLSGQGQLVAAMLHRVWAQPGERFSLSIAELTQAAPLLLKSGCGALGWSRIRGTSSADSAPGAQLHEAYRLHSLLAEVKVDKINRAFGLLQQAGVNPVIVKGWDIARLYPELGLRPFGDIDLCVAKTEFARTKVLLKGASFRGLPIDLHDGFASLGAATDQEFLLHSRRVRLDDVEATVLSPEHHLRALCVHMLRHGAFRPLWLVDIAVAVENRSPDFDWQLCLGNDQRRVTWVKSAIGLAHELLGARIADTPAADLAGRLPQWLVNHVLRAWSSPEGKKHGVERHAAPMRKYLSHPRGLIADLKNRWPDPVEATISVGGPFNRVPRLPYQLGNCLLRAGRFLRHLPRPLTESPNEPVQTGYAVEK